MSAPIAWDGVPLHAADERRWHWLQSRSGELVPRLWLPRSKHWDMGHGVEASEDMATLGFRYRGVCPWPDELAQGGTP